MASASVHSKAVVLLFLINCLLLPPLFVGALCLVLFVMQYLVFFLDLHTDLLFAIISLRKRAQELGVRSVYHFLTENLIKLSLRDIVSFWFVGYRGEIKAEL